MGFIARFFLLVLVLSFAELYLLVRVSARIGFGITLLLCVLTGVLGGALVRHQGLRTLRHIQESLSRGRLPAAEIGSGLILLVIGTMLLTPGFITDTVAFLLLIPPLRKLAVKGLFHFFKRYLHFRMAGTGNRRTRQARPRRPEDVIIEVDAEEVE